MKALLPLILVSFINQQICAEENDDNKVITKLKSELVSLTAEIGKKVHEIVEKMRHVNTKISSCHSKESIKSCSDDCDNAKRDIDCCRKEMWPLIDKCVELKKELASYGNEACRRQQIKTCENKLNNTLHQLGVFKNKLQGLIEKNNILVQKYDRMIAENNLTLEDVERLKKEIDSGKKELANIEKRFSDKKSEYQKACRIVSTHGPGGDLPLGETDGVLCHGGTLEAGFALEMAFEFGIDIADIYFAYQSFGATAVVKNMTKRAIKNEIRARLKYEARGRVQHELHKIELRRAMEKPHVEDAHLKNIVDDLYRPNATIGSGSTAAAVRYENATGEMVGGRTHTEKARNYIAALKKWLNRNPHASHGDKAAAENIILDLVDALENP